MSSQNNLLVVDKNEKPSQRKNAKKTPFFIMYTIIIILFVLCVSLLWISCKIKVDEAKNAYDKAKPESENIGYENTEKKLFGLGEKRYHTSNRIDISIDGIEKDHFLETLKVKEIDYYIHNGDENIKSKAWYKIIGEGTFVVNMDLAEIITDEERNYILIKVPLPTLQTDAFNVTVEQFYFDKGNFEGIKKGEELASMAEKEGYKKIKAKILGKQEYFKCAKNSAKSQLINLAKECNPGIDVNVDVEFFD